VLVRQERSAAVPEPGHLLVTAAVRVAAMRSMRLAQRAETIRLLGERYQADPRLADARGRATRYVGGVGSYEPLVVFVGEAPGGTEDAVGQPFVGRSGKLLDRLLAEHGISRLEDCWTTNIVRYRPPGDADPRRPHLDTSLPYLRAEIAALHPDVVATLGRISTRALWPQMPAIYRCHGVARPLWSDKLLLPMLHPSYALRLEANLAQFRADVASLAALIQELIS
jgi:uracil-DNA glycosylase family 4